MRESHTFSELLIPKKEKKSPLAVAEHQILADTSNREHVEQDASMTSAKNTLTEMLEITLQGPLTPGKDIVEQTIADIADGAATKNNGKIDKMLSKKYREEYKTIFRTDETFRKRLDEMAHARYKEMFDEALEQAAAITAVQRLADVKQLVLLAMEQVTKQGVPTSWLAQAYRPAFEARERDYKKPEHLWKKLEEELSERDLRDLKTVLDSTEVFKNPSALLHAIGVINKEAGSSIVESVQLLIPMVLREKLLAAPLQHAKLEAEAAKIKKKISRNAEGYRYASKESRRRNDPKDELAEARTQHNARQQELTRTLHQMDKEVQKINLITAMFHTKEKKAEAKKSLEVIFMELKLTDPSGTAETIINDLEKERTRVATTYIPRPKSHKERKLTYSTNRPRPPQNRNDDMGHRTNF